MSFSNRYKMFGLLGIPLLAVAVAVLVLAWGNTANETYASNVDTKTQMDLVVSVGGSPICQSDPAQQNQCDIGNNTKFTLSVVPSVIPQDADPGTAGDQNGYGAWAALVDFGSLLYQGAELPASDPGTGETIEMKWDQSSPSTPSVKSVGGSDAAKNEDGSKGGPGDCGDTVDNDSDGDTDAADANCGTQVAFADAAGVFPPFPLSQQKTSLVNMDFQCNPKDASQKVELIPRSTENPSGANYKGVNNNVNFTPNVGSLQINCITPPTATNTPTQTDTPVPPTPTNTPSAPSSVKSPGLSNLWLTRQGEKIPPTTCTGSTDGAVLTQAINTKVTGQDKAGDDRDLGAFEFEVDYSDAVDKICVTIIPGPVAQAWLADGGACIIQDSVTKPTLQGSATIACNKLGKDDISPPLPEGANQILANIVVQPQPDAYSEGKPNNGNGQVVQLNNVGCKIADEQGDPVAPPPEDANCTDADVTIRWLEGDVEPSCEVDTGDTQAIAFRWNSSKGNLLYNDRFNVEPSAPQADEDIDVLDLQFVYGRFGSTCDAPHPDQPPVNAKA